MPSPVQSTTPDNSADKLPVWGQAFILLLVLAPLPFGANRPLFSNFLALSVATLLCFLCWDEYTSPKSFSNKAPFKRLRVSAVCISLVAIWSFLQVVSITPTSWHHPIWQEASAVLPQLSGAISIDTGVFPEALSRLLSYVGCFFLSFTLSQNVENARRIINALAYAAVAYALYGLLVLATGSNSILWFDKWAYSGFLTSTFVNKNSYAVYSGIGLLCCLAYAHNHFRRNFVLNDYVLAQKSKLAAILATLGFKDLAILAMPTVVMAALALTGSRAGIVCSLLGIVAFLTAFAVNQKSTSTRSITAFGFYAVVFAIFLALGGNVLMERMGEQNLSADADLRLSAYELAKTAIMDNPWLGYGLGTFESAFRLYRDSTLSAWFHHAHNDYLEMIMDLGIPAAALLFIAIGLVLSCCIQGIIVRKRSVLYPVIAIASSLILGMHCLVDFSLHIPAIAATYATLLGTGAAQSWSSRNTGD